MNFIGKSPQKIKTSFLSFRLSLGKLLPPIALLSEFLLEALSRHSVTATLSFIAVYPIRYLYNSLILLLTLSLCLLAKRRLMVLTVILSAWLSLGVTNAIVLGFRASPLSAIDFTVIRSAIGLASLYLSPVQMILIVLAAVTLVLFLLILLKKCPKCQVNYPKSAVCIVEIGLILWGITALSGDVVAVDYESGELAEVYDSYGFVSCFTRSLISQGVEEPDNYSHAEVAELIREVDGTSEPLSTETVLPNIVFVQLESFMDVSHIKNLVCSEDPTPNFTALKENGISGYLRMANVGGGTANSEFEVLTGMNLDHFGFGEYPYTTVLQSHSCMSIASDLKQFGYSSHALHNHIAGFYDRYLVYDRLGFDSFTPVEMMTDVTYNALGWECDAVLTKEILSALDSTDTQDFVFAVSVECHGNYPDEMTDTEGISVSLYGKTVGDNIPKETERLLAQYTYYVNALRQTDNFIGTLLSELAVRDEPTVVVFYGDHLPAIGLSAADLENGDLYQTEYAVWSNIPLGNNYSDSDGNFPNSFDKDMEAYCLSAQILSLCSLEGNPIFALHNKEAAAGEIFDEELRILEYAMLYDDTITDTVDTEPDRIRIRYGTHDVTIDGLYTVGNSLYLYGSGFNSYSHVTVGGFSRSAVLLNSHVLRVDNVYFLDKGVDRITVEVSQITDDNIKLSSTVYPAKE